MTDTNNRTVATTRRLQSFAVVLLWWTACVARNQAEAQQPQHLRRDLTNRIVGGTVASPTRYPYFTIVELSFTNIGKLSCGASLIAPDIVLTAAHCVDGPSYFGDVQIEKSRIWVNRSSTSDETKFGFRRKILDIVVHPGWDKVAYANDIAVIKLNAVVAGVPTVLINRNASIPLPTQSIAAIGVGVTSTTNNSATSTDKLMQVSMKPVSFRFAARTMIFMNRESFYVIGCCVQVALKTPVTVTRVVHFLLTATMNEATYRWE